MNLRSLTAFAVFSTLAFIALSARYMKLGDVFASSKNSTEELVTTERIPNGLSHKSKRQPTSLDYGSVQPPKDLTEITEYIESDREEYDEEYDSEEWMPKLSMPGLKDSVRVGSKDKPDVDQMDPKIKELREIHKKRREMVKNVCIRNSVYPTAHNIIPEKFQHIYVNDKYKLLYCSIPKVACTNWKRVMLVLSGKVNTTNPMSLTPRETHSTEMSKFMPTLDLYSKKEVQYRLKNYFKFVFVRDPLERLLSAFNNKFTVSYNEYFNQRYGRRIIKKYRKNPSKKSLKTGRQVKFEEFIKYLLDPETGRPFNDHWREYYKLCYPCLIQYDAVGKYDTFDDDVDYVLNITGVNKVVQFPRSNHLKDRPKTSNILEHSYGNITSEEIHKLWETYSVDYAMFGYPYPDLKPH